MADVVLLALNEEIAQALQGGVAGRRDVLLTEVHRSSAPLAVAIEQAREQWGRAPLGVAARTRTEAIEAIELGADEAMTLEAPSLSEVLELIDRTRARGLRRAQHERERIDIAHAEKLAALGTLVAGVAHEINNPLSVLVLGLGVLPSHLRAAGDVIDEIERATEQRRGLSADEVAQLASMGQGFGLVAHLLEQLEDMTGAAEMILDVVKDLRVFARADDGEPAVLVRIPELLDQILRLVGREIASNALVERDYGPEVAEVIAPPSRLTQVFTNVLVNATHALREVQRDVHRVRIAVRSDESAIAVSISDTGPGIPPQSIERIFDPFYTTKRANLGTGLGLSISRNLMRRLGGDLLVESVYGEGATFIVIIPRSSDSDLRAARRKPTVSVTPPVSRVSVLMVDEDPRLLRMYSRVLGSRFDLVAARDAEEAIALLESGSHADVVVADLGLSVHDGAELHGWLMNHRAELAARVIFVASEPTLPRHRELLTRRSNPVLPKPTPPEALIAAIEQIARS